MQFMGIVFYFIPGDLNELENMTFRDKERKSDMNIPKNDHDKWNTSRENSQSKKRFGVFLSVWVPLAAEST